MAKYECDKCGACCSELIVEIQHLDVVREPKLLPHAKLMDGNGALKFDSDWEKQYLLAAGYPCGLLDCNNNCTVYPTRPNVCVALQAGGLQCQLVRKQKGLPYLADADGNVPTDEQVEALDIDEDY